MGNAFWLFCSLPLWYFGSIGHVHQAGLLAIPPVVGTVFLLAGVLAACLYRRWRRPRLILFVAPLLLAQLFVTMAGLYRGDITGGVGQSILIWGFLSGQFAVCAYLIRQTKGARLPATALSIFIITYTLYAIFIGGMAMSDSWL